MILIRRQSSIVFRSIHELLIEGDRFFKHFVAFKRVNRIHFIEERPWTKTIRSISLHDILPLTMLTDNTNESRVRLCGAEVPWSVTFQV